MKIFVMRHGDAAYKDNDRVLSDKGIKESTEVAVQICAKYKINKIFASPKTRAQQTATVVINHLNKDLMIETLTELSPDGDPITVRSFIDATCSENDIVLLVSHIPLVQELIYELTSHHEFGPDFVTSSALLLDYNGIIATPEHFFSPTQERWY